MEEILLLGNVHIFVAVNIYTSNIHVQRNGGVINMCYYLFKITKN